MAMASIESATLEVADPASAHRFYTARVDTQIRLRASEAPTTGFRGFTLALTVSPGRPPSTASSTPLLTPAPRR
jgi:hypothetical protein